jgi:hypothetical protein
MTSTWARRALLAAAVCLAPTPAAAQRASEHGVKVIGTAQDDGLVVAGLSGALRPARRLRLLLSAGAGSAGGELVFRSELLGHFLLSPASRGIGMYGGGGVALVAGPDETGYLVLLLGVEQAPGGSGGWFVEGGLGGGVRGAAGYRWRRFGGRRVAE